MIILFGAAGSGKSTQGKILAHKFGWKWLSVGEVIRNTGKFDEITKAGGLVDDKIVIELMRKEMEKAEMEGLNVVLDGYPRDTTQAEWCRENMQGKIEGAIVLEVPREELFKRIEMRGRNDDVQEVVEKRIAIFEKHIAVILPMLEKMGVEIVRVDGSGKMEEVTGRIVEWASKWTGETMIETEEDLDDGMTREKSYGE